MTTLDSRVASVLDRHGAHDSDSDEDAILAALEDEEENHNTNTDNVLAGFREQRLQQLHEEFSRAKAQRETGAGTYTEFKDEKAVLDLTTSTKLSVVHFMKPDFTRCRFMDDKLEALAPKHFDTRFASINVENAPFLVAKLKIQVLPCVIAFVNGVAVDRIIGFEGIGRHVERFTLAELEARLLQSGVLVRSKMTDSDERALSRNAAARKAIEDDEDDDWD